MMRQDISQWSRLWLQHVFSRLDFLALAVFLDTVSGLGMFLPVPIFKKLAIVLVIGIEGVRR